MQRPFAPRALPRFPATMASSDYCPRLRYWQFSQVPVQNFRGTPSPLPRCARRTQIESVRRCWLHAYRIADHADLKLTRLYVGGSLALRLTALSGRTPAHRSPSARSAILIVCRFLYDIAPSAISSAELLLGVPVSLVPGTLPPHVALRRETRRQKRHRPGRRHPLQKRPSVHVTSPSPVISTRQSPRQGTPARRHALRTSQPPP